MSKNIYINPKNNTLLNLEAIFAYVKKNLILKSESIDEFWHFNVTM